MIGNSESVADDTVRGMIRVIPRLDIKGPNLVKGVNLEGLRVLGKPDRFAEHYFLEGADELLYVDVVASLYGRNSILSFIEEMARRVFIPITVGGGLRSTGDIRAVLSAGADKVAINSAGLQSPGFITEVAERFGSSTIVVSIEAIEQPNGTYEAFFDSGRGALSSGRYRVGGRGNVTGSGRGDHHIRRS